MEKIVSELIEFIRASIKGKLVLERNGLSF